MRKDPLSIDSYYHVFSRSIASYQIFARNDSSERFIEMLSFYRFSNLPYKYSEFARLNERNKKFVKDELNAHNPKAVEIISYCLMPTHFHLILKSLEDEGIIKFMRKLLDSYTRYFNLLHSRKGPLWESHFKNVLITSDEVLLHLTRYIHLNPVSAGLVEKPEDWKFSSYLEHTSSDKVGICDFDGLFDLTPAQYRKFVEEHIDYQLEISIIKGSIIENYLG